MSQVRLAKGDALVVIDMQNDFLPGGRLPVAHGNRIIGTVNRYIDRFLQASLPIVATRDWHPPEHCSFQEQGGPWPVHCVADTPGADFAPSLRLPDTVLIVSKAQEAHKEAYSSFSGTTLDGQLRRLAVKRLFVCGLATDYCVLKTVEDAVHKGYDVVLLVDAICAIGTQPKDGERAIERMKQLGARPITLNSINGQ